MHRDLARQHVGAGHRHAETDKEGDQAPRRATGSRQTKSAHAMPFSCMRTL